MKRLLFIAFILASCSGWTQDAFIFVKDKQTGQALEFVHLIYKGLETNKTQYNTTNIKGRGANLASETTFLTISFIGYTSILDTIYPGKNYTYELESGSSDLEEIVVTAQYAPVSESNSVYKVKVINQDFIKNRGSLNVQEALNTQLNIRIQQDNILGSSFKIQGLDGENVKILIDGVPVVGRLNGNVDLSQLNMNNVERIEVIEGPMSVNYGSNALAGAINIITKNPENQRMGANMFGQYESVGNYNIGGGINLGNKTNSVLVDGGRNFFEGWSEYDTTRSQDWNQKEQYFGQLKYKHIFKNLTFGYSFNGLWEQIKDRGDRRGEHSNYAFDFWYTTQRYINSIDLSFSAGPFTNSQVLASYTYFTRTNDQYNRDLVNLEQDLVDSDTTDVNSLMSRGTFSTARDKKWNYQIGYDINAENGTGERISDDAGTFIDAGFFGNINWSPSLRWNFQPGVRWAYNNNYNAPLVPSIHVKYNINKNTLLRMSYAHGFRAPSIKELYLEFVDQNHRIFGNQDLMPENSRNMNLSIIWRDDLGSSKKSLKIEPSVYYNHILDKIQLVQTGTSNLEYTYQNIADYETFGGKFEVNYNIHPDFSFGLGAGWLGYTNIEKDNIEGSPEYLSTPEMSATFAYWRSSKKFNFNVIYKYTGATVAYFLDAQTDQIVQSELPGYSWMDINASQKLWENRIELGAGVKNAFDITSLNFSGGANSGGVHSGGSAMNVGWGRSWFVRCNIKL